MIRTMNTITTLIHHSGPFFEMTTEPKLVAFTQFYGVLNVPSRMWMIRDWARRIGYHLVGLPQCIFHPGGDGPEHPFCEVEWEVEEAATEDGGDVALRWSDGCRIIVGLHIGESSAVEETISALKAWGEAMGYCPNGTRREIYHLYLRGSAGEPVSEVQLVVEGASTGRGTTRLVRCHRGM